MPHPTGTAMPGAATRRGGEIAALQYARAAAALLVLLFHTEELLGAYFPVTAGWRFFAGGSSGVEFFFVLSGFIIHHAHRRDLGHPERFGTFWQKRFIRILPMFWLVIVPLGLVYLASPDLGADRDLTPGRWLRDLLLIPRPDKLTLPPAWTLQHELMFYGVFGLMILNLRLGAIAFVAWQAACLATLVGGLLPSSYLDPRNKFLGVYNFGFAFGLGVALLHGRLAAWLTPARTAALGCAVLAGLAVMYHAAYANAFGGALSFMNGHDAPSRVAYFALYAGAILFLISIPNLSRPWLDRTLGVVGAASFTLYLTHQPVSSALFKLFGAVSADDFLAPWLAFILVVAATVAAAIAVHRLVEQPMTRYLRDRLMRQHDTANVGSTEVAKS